MSDYSHKTIILDTIVALIQLDVVIVLFNLVEAGEEGRLILIWIRRHMFYIRTLALLI